MTEIAKIRKRLEDINRQADKPFCDLEILAKELESLTKAIYQAVDNAGKEDRMQLDELNMLKNVIEFKIEKKQRS